MHLRTIFVSFALVSFAAACSGSDDSSKDETEGETAALIGSRAKSLQSLISMNEIRAVERAVQMRGGTIISNRAEITKLGREIKLKAVEAQPAPRCAMLGTTFTFLDAANKSRAVISSHCGDTTLEVNGTVTPVEVTWGDAFAILDKKSTLDDLLFDIDAVRTFEGVGVDPTSAAKALGPRLDDTLPDPLARCRDGELDGLEFLRKGKVVVEASYCMRVPGVARIAASSLVSAPPGYPDDVLIESRTTVDTGRLVTR